MQRVIEFTAAMVGAFWQFVGDNQAQIQVCILFAALVYAIGQTRGLRQQIKLSLITTLSSHLKETNEDLLQYSTVAKDFGMTEHGSFASILIGIFALWYDLHKARLLDHYEWNSSIETMKIYMGQQKMREYWNAEGTQRQYHKPFRDFVNSEIYGEGRRKRRRWVFWRPASR